MDYFEKPRVFPPQEYKNIPPVEKTERSKKLDKDDSNKKESNNKEPKKETPEERERKRKEKNEAEGKGRILDVKV